MDRYRSFALAFLLLAAAFAHVGAKRLGGFGGKPSSRHSYPSSHGHSGGGSHSYPHSGGLSGHGGGHQAHTQQHASVQHSQPASSGAHGYPHSPGLSGHSNPSGGHSYPGSPGLSGSGHSYPGSHGSSGSTQHVHHHQYTYNPPSQIHYTPSHGAPVHYPVYHGPAPVYVQNFHDSGSRFSNLLTGLALYNLGRSVAHGHHSSSSAQRADAHGERCTLRIEQDRNLEIVKIPCYIISTFTDANSVNKAINNTNLNSSVTTMTTPANASVTPAVVSAVVNNSSLSSVATANDTVASSSLIVNSTLVANGSEVHNITHPEDSDSTPVPLAPMPPSALPENSTAAIAATPVVTSQAPVATQEPVKPEDVKGEPVKLSPTARCFVEHVTPSSTSRKEVECGLLQQYAMQSMRRQQARVNAAAYHGISLGCLVTTVGLFSSVLF